MESKADGIIKRNAKGGIGIKEILATIFKAVVPLLIVLLAVYAAKAYKEAQRSLATDLSSIKGATFIEANGKGYFFVGEDYATADNGSEEITGPYVYESGKITIQAPEKAMDFTALSSDKILALDWLQMFVRK